MAQSYLGNGRDHDHTKNQERKRMCEGNAILQGKKEIEIKPQQEHEKELEFIKEQYLGGKKSRKIIEKPSRKFPISFDWKDTEDTSRDTSLIHPKYEAQLLFGRGFRGGMDRDEQRRLAKKETKNTYEKSDTCTYRHWPEKKSEEMTKRDWRIFQEDCNISCKGSHIPRPVQDWNEVALDPKLLKVIQEKVGYSKPSLIQMVAIPIGLQQRDIIGIAETGSGKTTAYILPLLDYISKLCPMTEEMEAEGPLAIVLVPTRELAQQIEVETMKFAHVFNMRIVSIVGGQSIQEQGFKLTQGCEVVIATPGRLIDCLERRYTVLNQCHYMVLDEADRMIDMGFEPQVKAILDAMPSSVLGAHSQDGGLDTTKMHRTTCMFSATMSSTVERLAQKYLHNPIMVTIGTKGKVTKNITQYVEVVKEGEKLDTLCHILNEMADDRTTIVFVNAKHTADTLWRNLDKSGYQVGIIHGGKTQGQREESLDGFRSKKFKCLVATDVVARGIDIANISHVINYDMPEKIEMYIHRIGRTARAGKQGIATTFLTLQDYNIFYDLKQVLLQSNSHIPPELASYKSSKDRQAYFH
jgi:ATP-dependent RNA helicase DDX23/PRP28